MKIATIKSILWFLVIMLLALSFPLQVYFNSPLPSLIPYILLCVILAIKFMTSTKAFIIFGGFLSELASFPVNMLQFPPGFLIGDGFTPEFGVIAKGSDYGFVETLHPLGLPLFLVIFMGLISLIRRSLWQIRSLDRTENSNARYLQFAVCVTIYLFFSEIHYTVWNAKSILPILFLCLAIFSRYLPPPRRFTKTTT